MKRIISTILFSAIATLTMEAQQHLLWYDKPATHWLQALPIGNSHLGAMIYGDVKTEEIQLNEETFWSGSPYYNNSPESKEHLQEVRQLIFEGKEKEASNLIDQYFIKGPHGMRFLPVGSVKLAFHRKDDTSSQLPSTAESRYSHRYHPVYPRRCNLSTHMLCLTGRQCGCHAD